MLAIRWAGGSSRPVFDAVDPYLVFSDVSGYAGHAARALDGQVPYRDYLIEYPPLALPFFLLAGLLAPGVRAFQVIFAAEMLLANAAMMLLFTLRWWLVLRNLGYRIPLLAAARYRLAAFAVSFLTPGQHIGGEPLQVLFLRRHNVPADTAAASVAFDRLVEYFVNTAVLLGGLLALRAAGLFAGLPETFRVGRYHSLAVDLDDAAALEANAWTEDGEIMAIRHRAHPTFGVQFHPESILTEHGHDLLGAFLAQTAA